MKFKLVEMILNEYNENQVKQFITKYGDDIWDKFSKLDNQNIQKIILPNGKKGTPDITYYLKNNFSKDDMYNIIYNTWNANIPDPLHSKSELLIDQDSKSKLYFVDNYLDMIMMSEGTGNGSTGCKYATGWCVGGRFNQPYGKVSLSQAKRYFNQHLLDTDLDGYYILETNDANKFCIEAFKNGSIKNITDNDDIDHYNNSGKSLDYYSEVANKYPLLKKYLKVPINQFNDFNNDFEALPDLLFEGNIKGTFTFNEFISIAKRIDRTWIPVGKFVTRLTDKSDMFLNRWMELWNFLKENLSKDIFNNEDSFEKNTWKLTWYLFNEWDERPLELLNKYGNFGNSKNIKFDTDLNRFVYLFGTSNDIVKICKSIWKHIEKPDLAYHNVIYLINKYAIEYIENNYGERLNPKPALLLTCYENQLTYNYNLSKIIYNLIQDNIDDFNNTTGKKV